MKTALAQAKPDRTGLSPYADTKPEAGPDEKENRSKTQ
jgi:hypothetical protein